MSSAAIIPPPIAQRRLGFIILTALGAALIFGALNFVMPAIAAVFITPFINLVLIAFMLRTITNLLKKHKSRKSDS